tara:strand:- start:92 stop:283 length:192 start_codon:yes stop_codon:yes gene_type:complete
MLAKKKARLGEASLYLGTSSEAGRPKKIFLFGHLFLNITNVFCAKKGWGMLVYAPGWSLASQF